MSWMAGAVAGLLGGFVAAGVMSLGHKAIGAMMPPPDATPAPQEEDATVKVASVVADRLGYPLTEADKPRAGTVVHYVFGAGVGAVYGVLAELTPIVRIGVGLPFGAAVWLGAHAITVPALGLATPPTQRPFSQEAQEFGLHLLYGLATELARRLLRRL